MQQNQFKGGLKTKYCIEQWLPKLREIEGVDIEFAEAYIRMKKGRSLGNILVDDRKPQGPDVEILRRDALRKLVGKKEHDWVTASKKELWQSDGMPTKLHAQCIAWAWSPITEGKLLKALEHVSKDNTTDPGPS